MNNINITKLSDCYCVPTLNNDVAVIDRMDGIPVQAIEIDGRVVENIHGIRISRETALENGLFIDDNQGS